MIGFNFKRENLQRIFQLYCMERYNNPENIVLIGDKIIVNVTHARGEPLVGTLIIPADGSYIRFIRDSWYDGVDVENL